MSRNSGTKSRPVRSQGGARLAYQSVNPAEKAKRSNSKAAQHYLLQLVLEDANVRRIQDLTERAVPMSAATKAYFERKKSGKGKARKGLTWTRKAHA